MIIAYKQNIHVHCIQIVAQNADKSFTTPKQKKQGKWFLRNAEQLLLLKWIQIWAFFWDWIVNLTVHRERGKIVFKFVIGSAESEGAFYHCMASCIDFLGNCQSQPPSLTLCLVLTGAESRRQKGNPTAVQVQGKVLP